MLAAESRHEGSEINEHVANIRRAIRLEGEPLSSSSVKCVPGGRHAFMFSTLQALLPMCMEYYRDFSKHARRKRDTRYATSWNDPGTIRYILSVPRLDVSTLENFSLRPAEKQIPLPAVPLAVL